jgi:hypothetical protein
MIIRNIFISAVCIFMSMSSAAQLDTLKEKQPIDTVEVSGYYVYMYSKKEIKNLSNNRNRMKKGKSFKLSIGDEHNDFFIPSDSIKPGRSLPAILNGLALQNKQDIFVKYSSLDKYSFDEYNMSCLKSLNDAPELPPFVSSTYYVTNDKRSKLCFKIFSLSATCAKVVMPKETAIELLARRAKYLKPSESFYNVYVFKKIVSSDFSPVLDQSSVKLWRNLPQFWQ